MDNMTNIIGGVLITICISLSAFSLKWSFDSNAEIKVMNERIKNLTESVNDMSLKTELDKKQDSQLSKHWRLHGWSRDEINKLRHLNNQEPSSWPDLGGWD